MNMNKHIIKKELLVEFKNSSSLFLITPTMTVLIIIFPILIENRFAVDEDLFICLLYTSPSPRDKHRSRMPSSA